MTEMSVFSLENATPLPNKENLQKFPNVHMIARFDANVYRTIYCLISFSYGIL